MRRSLTRATAVRLACALALALGVATPAAAHEEALAGDGTAVSGDRSAAAGAEGETGGPVGADSASPDIPFAPAGTGGGRVEVDTSLWTHVDRAFPDLPRNGTETATVGTGNLAWDRVYTRRALFRFPVALDPDTVVDSAVLRTEVAWSYDCHSDSSVQLHRVDSFHAGTTWNDQPKARDLLDTRNVRGGRAACPVTGGVEFDVTEAYQWAVDHGQAHIHLRLGERDETAGTTWRRFDVRDDPPVLVVDHSPPPPPEATPGMSGAAGPVPAQDPSEGREDHAQSFAPVRTAEDRPRSAEAAVRFGGTDDARLQGLVPGYLLRTGGGRAVSRWKGRTSRPRPPGHRRSQVENTVPPARGPPRSVPRRGNTPQWAGHRDGRGAPPAPHRPQGAVAARGAEALPHC